MEDAHHSLPYVQEALLFLAAAVIVILVLHRARISPVLGYLLAGLLIGPSGLGLIGEVEEIRAVAELGVVFLLFVIGLELSVERLKALKRWVFGLGAAQVVLTSAAIGGIAWAWGNSVEAAVVLGMCLALSSTAVVVQLLVERGEVASPTGRLAFAVLLFQDLAVVPILVLVSVLGDPGDQPIAVTLGLSLVKAVVAVALILLIGRYTLGPLLRRVAATRSADLFTATALLIVLGTGWATNLGGLSAALGAFLAGLVLAGTEFRHQVETDIQPFKGLLLGLFFLTVGMGIDIQLIVDQLGMLLLSVVALIALKALITAALAVLFGAPRDVAIKSGLVLGEGGEFAFVVIGAALAGGLVPVETAQFMFAVVGLSIVVTPFLPTLAEKLAAIVAPPHAPPPGAVPTDEDGLNGHVIIAGFGRVGQTVAKLFAEQQVPWLAVDLGADLVRRMRADGLPVHYGDGSRPEILKQLQAGTASAVIVTLDQPAAAARTVEAVRHHWPDLKIFARSRDREHAADLLAQGCVAVVPETFESSLSLAKGALEALNVPSAAVDELLAKHRETSAEVKAQA